MIDYNLLTELVDYNKYRKTCFKNGLQPIFEDKQFESLLSARYQKCSRIKQHFLYLFHRFKYLYFITYTFDDDHLKLCDRSRKDLIKKSIRSFSSDIEFILNVDYGKKNERLHYHCIVATNDSSDFFSHTKSTYPCFTWIELIDFSNSSLTKISKYINKLSNHAIKSTTRNSRIYFSFKGYGSMSVSEVKKAYILDKDCLGL